MFYRQSKNIKNNAFFCQKFSNHLKFLGANGAHNKQKSKILANIAWRMLKFAVVWNRYLNLCVCTQSLKNSEIDGNCYTASNGHKVGVCALTSCLTKGLSFYGRVGAEYNSLTTANNARRFQFHGSLTSRSPFNLGEVLL